MTGAVELQKMSSCLVRDVNTWRCGHVQPFTWRTKGKNKHQFSFINIPENISIKSAWNCLPKKIEHTQQIHRILSSAQECQQTIYVMLQWRQWQKVSQQIYAFDIMQGILNSLMVCVQKQKEKKKKFLVLWLKWKFMTA